MLTEGLHPNVPENNYHAMPGASASRLNILRHKSALHLYDSILHAAEIAAEESDDEKKSLKIGSAFHMMILQPDLFDRNYVHVTGTCQDIKKGDGKPCSNPPIKSVNGKWLCGVHSKGLERTDFRSTLNDDEMAKLVGMKASIQANEFVRNLLEWTPERELTLVWNDPTTGALCRGRIDIPCFKVGIIGDLKTSRDASRDCFEKSIYSYGYDLQAEHYLDGCNTLGRPVDTFIDVVVESERPYALAVYPVAPEKTGRIGLLRQFKQCTDSGVWPGYDAGINEQISLPAWAAKKIERREMAMA